MVTTRVVDGRAVPGVGVYRPPITWVRDLTAVAAVTAYPTVAAATTILSGVPTPGGEMGDRIHVEVIASWASGTPSMNLSLYGLDVTANTLGGRWIWLAALNGGAAITIDQTRWSNSTTTVDYAEWFDVGGAQFDRYATRLTAVGGTTPSISTRIGFEVL